MNTMRCIDPEKIIPISRSTTELFKTGTWNRRRPEHRDKVSPCRAACPAGNNITHALFHAAQGDFDGALSAFLEENPLPGTCGSVCYHLCEAQCNRGEWDGNLPIRALERAASDWGAARPTLLTENGRDYRVAVVGSGPAGLSAAYHLARMGHPVTLIEAKEELGGLLRWAIPCYRLPEMVLKRDLERILCLDIQVQTGTRVDAAGLAELRATHPALFIAVGAQKGTGLDVPGAEEADVYLGLDFLTRVRSGTLKEIAGKVVVVGGGNVAIDAALTARRLGAEQVKLVCLEQRDEMPAHESECNDAVEEGVRFHNGWGPQRVLREDGRSVGIEFIRCTSVWDETGRFSPSYDDTTVLALDADHVIAAIGQAPDPDFLKGRGLFKSAPGETIQVNPHTMETTIEGVFIGGDLVQAPGSVVEAIAAGKRAALAIHLNSQGMPFEEAEERLRIGTGPCFSIDALYHPVAGWDQRTVVRFEDLEPLFLDHQLPVMLRRLDSAARKKGFQEITLPLNAGEATQEAGRCFLCGRCTGCDRCFIYCPDMAVVSPAEGQVTYEVDPDYCKGCAVCVSVCPRGVMTMSERT